MLYLVPRHPFFMQNFNDLLARELPSEAVTYSYSLEEDMKESKLTFDMPGTTANQVSVTFDNGFLFIENIDKSFSKAFAVDTNKTDLDKLTATLTDGILTVIAPKLPKPEPLAIPVTSELVKLTAQEDSFSMDLPGVKAEDVSITLHDNAYIVVQATRKSAKKDHKFSKTMSVEGEVLDLSQLKASLHDGVLVVHGPRKPKPEPIEVNVTNSIEGTVTSRGPDADLFEFTMDLPGVKASDLSLKVDEDVLRVTATRTYSNGKKMRLNKAATLDDRVQRDKLQAILADGVLTVTAPQTPSPAPRKIPVGEGLMEA